MFCEYASKTLSFPIALHSSFVKNCAAVSIWLMVSALMLASCFGLSVIATKARIAATRVTTIVV